MAEEPIIRDEAKFIRRKEDVVTLRIGREHTAFDSFVERFLAIIDDFLRTWFRCRVIQYLFLTQELRAKSTTGHVRYFGADRIDTLVNIITAIVVFILLVLPVKIMHGVSNLVGRKSALDVMRVLGISTLIFGMAISSLTSANRRELFGASAAYCAVLAVCIGNFGVK